MRTKNPTLAYLRNEFWRFFDTGYKNHGDFDSETSIMTVALLANSRAARTASSFTFRARV